MKKLFVLFFVVLLVLTTVMIPIANATNSTQSQKMIVIFADGKVNKDIIRTAKGKINKEFKYQNALAVTLPENSINDLANTPGVIKVEPDFVFTASGKPTHTPTPPPAPVIPSQTTDWGVGRVNAPAAWANGNTGEGVNIAVLDTGIAPHPDLTIAGGVAFTGITGNSYSDDNGHGTHVAGIIASMDNEIGVVGVAPKANLYAVKVLNSYGSGYVSDIVAGIEWAIDNNINIINMSLGSSSYSVLLEAAVNKAYSKGILLVAAAGNSGTKRTTLENVEYPAKFGSVIAVAATDPYNSRASFSSTGSEVEVSAPGVNIKSTYLNNSYATMSGTSMAAPMVAGDLALLIQAKRKLTTTPLTTTPLTTTDLRLLLDQLDQSVIDLGADGKDNLYGYGLIQAP